MKQLGSGYSAGTTVEFSAPELPGGVTATGSVKIGQNGEIYEVTLESPGRGYIRIPSATIIDSGTSGGDAVLEVRAIDGTKAVDMGYCSKIIMERIIKYLFSGDIITSDLSLPNLVKMMNMSSMMMLDTLALRKRANKYSRIFSSSTSLSL